jgi:hypothetical protein
VLDLEAFLATYFSSDLHINAGTMDIGWFDT